MRTAIVYQPAADFALPPFQRRTISLIIYFGFAALAVGVINGFAQALNYAGIDIFQYYPGMRTYYQGLTVHGVFNVIILTFAFANGFVSLTTARGLNRPLNSTLLAASLASLVACAALAAGAILSGHASVLYTFYAPLQAHWTFYLGLVLIVVSSWLTSINIFVTVHAWRRDHAGERLPLLAFISALTYIFWDIASIGIAIETVGFLLPWSLGLMATTDPLLDRTLFWFTGHPIVYFWLLPVYISWYAMIPRQVGGSLFSDTAVRIVFVMFLIIIPIGLHHQFVDPGISPGLKFAVAALTFIVFLPSLLTAFSVMYALEIGSPAQRWHRRHLVVLQPAMVRSISGRAIARDARFHARRRHRLDERQLHDQLGSSQYRVRTRSFSSHGRNRRRTIIHGDCLLAGSVLRAKGTVGPQVRSRAVVALLYRRTDFGARVDLRRTRRNAAPHCNFVD